MPVVIDWSAQHARRLHPQLIKWEANISAYVSSHAFSRENKFDTWKTIQDSLKMQCISSYLSNCVPKKGRSHCFIAFVTKLLKYCEIERRNNAANTFLPWVGWRYMHTSVHAWKKKKGTQKRYRDASTISQIQFLQQINILNMHYKVAYTKTKWDWTFKLKCNTSILIYFTVVK